MNDSIVVAEQLQAEGAAFMENEGIKAMLERHGPLEFAGSFALGLMAYRDIDMNLRIDDPKKQKEVAAELMGAFVAMEPSYRILYANSLHIKHPTLPVGTYLGIRMGWKFDIWMLDEAQVEATRAKTQKVKELLDDRSRRIILDWKFRHLQEDGSTPKFSGHWLYEAVLEKGLSKDEEINRYLRTKGIQI